jgi:hypothetical protein
MSRDASAIQLMLPDVGVEKVTPIGKTRFSRSMLEGTLAMLCLILIVVGGLLNDGATRPL